MATQPIPSWYEGTNTTSTEITSSSVVSYGQVDADTVSPNKEMFFWNNRGGQTNVSKMEDVTFTVRDRNGGTGDTVGNIVEAVRDNWFEVKCDTLNENNFVPVGKGGSGTLNPSGVHGLGTTASTTNINAESASVWVANTPYALGRYIKPTVDDGNIYMVTVAGTSDSAEPTWNTTEGLFTDDGTVKYVAVPIIKTPSENEILGLANNTTADGTNANLAGGNFVKFTTHVNVPISATSGLNPAAFRISWKFV